MHSLIVHSLRKKKAPKDENDKSNLVKPILSKLFPNAKSVHIDNGKTSTLAGDPYAFSLCEFLSLLRMTKWQQITIKARGADNWISELWASKRSLIQKEYDANGYCIVHSTRGIV